MGPTMGRVFNVLPDKTLNSRYFFGRDKMEEIVKSINRKEEGGDGLADEFILKYAEVQHG